MKRCFLVTSQMLALGIFGLLPSCRPSDCNADGVCDCHGRDECVISCPQDGCDVSCSQTSQSCGAVCGDDCEFECSDSNHCSSYSQDRSHIDCHNLPSCASECGEECEYRCEDVSECFVHAGPRSRLSCDHVALCDVVCEGGDCAVDCNNVSRCFVACEGECEVELTCNSVANCELTCPNGTKRTELSSGTYRCEEDD